MANNLKDHLKEVADAIRAKKSTTDLINPQDFATEIEGISGGGSGGGESGGLNIEYLDVSGLSKITRGIVSLYGAMFARGIIDDGAGNVGLCVASLAAFATGKDVGEWGDSIQAIAVDLSQEIIILGGKMSVRDSFTAAGINIDLDSIPRITKEQFYSLD